MRIRKNSKLSASVIVGSSSIPPETLQAHVCHLNRSPWDLIPPPHHSSSSFQTTSFEEEEGGGERDGYSLTTNGTNLDDSINGAAAGDSSKSMVELMISSSENQGKRMMETSSNGYGGASRTFSYTNIGNGAADDGHLPYILHSADRMRFHHQNRSPPPPPPRKRGRPRKSSHQVAVAPPPPATTVPVALSSPSSNPYEFYYYAGFGPRWGKKRGGYKVEEAANYNRINDIVVHDHEAGYDPDSTPCDQYCCSVMEESGHQQQLDYNGNGDEEEEEENGTGLGGSSTGVAVAAERMCKKRGRKPIKARSLKSLM